MKMAMQCLTQPSAQARVGTRWWWYGCAVTREEIERELSIMEEASLGMAEIQIIYALESDDPARERHHIDYFSPEFFDLLDYTLSRAKAHHIDIDFTLGSGWPFGGSFVRDIDAPSILVPYQHDVTGPATFSFDYTCVLNGEIERVILCPVRDGVMDAREARDITDHVQPTYIYTWQWGSRLADVSVPAGPHKIYTFVVQKYKQNIGKPAPNMQGLALDHCRKEVVDAYMGLLGGTLVERLGRGRIHGFFCDSIELGGNNWAANLLDEFKARKGYDLAPYLPALWGDMGDVTPLVRGDYFEVFGDLALEYFFQNFAAWCRRLGAQSRIQAHGIWSDILMAYAAADVPEGETFGEHDCYFVNTIHRRLAVSAGMLYGREIVSNESFTWLRMPRFQVTPEMIKRAADAILVDGINRIVNHGFSYSPQDVGRPGWCFYASSVINMNNTWWDYYPPLSRYLNRLSALMQGGKIVSPVAVYLPQADVRAESPMAEMHMALRLEDKIGRDTVNHLQRAGYWFTFLNDDKLRDLPPERFRAIVLCGAKRVSVETARALARLDQAGVSIVAVGQLPDDTCGLTDYEARRTEVRCLMTSLRRARIAPDHLEGLTKSLGEVCEPDLLVEGEAAQDVGFIHRLINGEDVYLIANLKAQARDLRLSIPFAAPVRLFDPMTMRDTAPLALERKGARTFLTMHLDENQSLVLLVGEEGLSPAPRALPRTRTRVTSWHLIVDGREIASGMPDPVGWEQFPETRFFSGEGTYEARFSWEGGPAQLLLEGVSCCCTVLLNGEEEGRLWMKPFRLPLTHLRPGENTLTIRAVSTWINHMINPDTPEAQPVKQVTEGWPYFGAIVEDTRHRRLDPVRERAMIKAPQPAGLTGPVWLLA